MLGYVSWQQMSFPEYLFFPWTSVTRTFESFLIHQLPIKVDKTAIPDSQSQESKVKGHWYFFPPSSLCLRNVWPQNPSISLEILWDKVGVWYDSIFSYWKRTKHHSTSVWYSKWYIVHARLVISLIIVILINIQCKSGATCDCTICFAHFSFVRHCIAAPCHNNLSSIIWTHKCTYQ